MSVLPLLQAKAPEVDFAGLSPFIALSVGLVALLMLGLLRSETVRRTLVPLLALLTLATAAGLQIWKLGENEALVEGALRIDDLTGVLALVVYVAAAATVLLSWRERAAEEAGHGEYHALLIASVLGMAVLLGAENLVTLFLGFELLSIPLYVLCATDLRRANSLESGLKYLIVGSVGSATLLYGLAFIYGATGSTDFAGIDAAVGGAGEIANDPLLLTGVGLALVGLAFKTSVAPFHQWTPDVYEGAPSPITAFMAVATKAAAFGVFLRLFDKALIGAALDWGPLLAVLAVVTIVVGNVGALSQRSLKRLLAYSSIAQAGYMLAGVLVATRLGVEATVFYLVAYLVMNLAAFAVVIARERQTPHGDDLASVAGLGRENPALAWPLTIAMLGLAGLPATAGFIGKFQLLRASLEQDYVVVAVAIVLGSAVSLAYYLRVIAAMWMPGAASRATASAALARRPGVPAMAGGAPADGERTGGEGQGDPGEAAGAFHGEDTPASEPSGEAPVHSEEEPSTHEAPGDDADDEAEEHEGGATALGARRPGVHGVLDRAEHPEVVAVAVVFAALTVLGGVIPGPVFDLARDAGAAFRDLL